MIVSFSIKDEPARRARPAIHHHKGHGDTTNFFEHGAQGLAAASRPPTTGGGFDTCDRRQWLDTEIEQFSEFRVEEARDDGTDILADPDVVRQVPASTGNVYRATHHVD